MEANVDYREQNVSASIIPRADVYAYMERAPVHAGARYLSCPQAQARVV